MFFFKKCCFHCCCFATQTHQQTSNIFSNNKCSNIVFYTLFLNDFKHVVFSFVCLLFFMLGDEEVGDIALTFRLSNIDLNPKNVLALIFSYPQIILHNATIMYRDDSLIDRLIKKMHNQIFHFRKIQ